MYIYVHVYIWSYVLRQFISYNHDFIIRWHHSYLWICCILFQPRNGYNWGQNPHAHPYRSVLYMFYVIYEHTYTYRNIYGHLYTNWQMSVYIFIFVSTDVFIYTVYMRYSCMVYPMIYWLEKIYEHDEE